MSQDEKIALEAFNEEREKTRRKRLLDQQLVARFKANLPSGPPLWDTSQSCFEFTEVRNDLASDGLAIYEAPTEAVFAGLQDAWLYEASTLWSKHDDVKIARILEYWSKGTALSPPFFIKHEKRNVWMVPDGKHRLTAARAMNAQTIPFIVRCMEAQWVEIAFPDAILIRSRAVQRD
jgi:hypothetical protein